MRLLRCLSFSDQLLRPLSSPLKRTRPRFLINSLHSHSLHPSQSLLYPNNPSIYNTTIISLSSHPNPEIGHFLQKGFTLVRDKIVGKALHCVCVKGLVPFCVLYYNTLMNMYARLGDLGNARNLFDEMPERNEASWNTIVSGVVRARLYRDAAGLFRGMRRSGFIGNEFVIGSLVAACTRSEEMVCEGFQVHGLVVKLGIVGDVFVGSALLHFYGAYGIIGEARKFFEGMPSRNTVSWTSLMLACSDAGQPKEVVTLYRKMREEGHDCSESTFTTLISSCCGMLEHEGVGFQVLGHVIKCGFECNVSVGNSLVSLFGNLGNFEDARYIFDGMEEHDTISWNSLITAYAHNELCDEALGCFKLMRNVHDEVDAATFSSLLVACDSVGSSMNGKSVHGLTVKFGLDGSTCVCNTLITMYSCCGSLEDAVFLFREMPLRDIISWNSMLACYVQHGGSMATLELLTELMARKLSTNHVTFATAVAACSSQGLICLGSGRTLHALAIVNGLQDNDVVGNSLVTFYGKCNLMTVSARIFKKMQEPGIIAWNALIGGYAENQEPSEAVKAFRALRRGSRFLNYITIINILPSFSSSSDLYTYGQPIHAYIVSAGFESDEYVKNSLITMYAKCGDPDSSSFIFSGLEDISLVTYNSMIAANARHGRGEDTLKLFRAMYDTSIELDQFSFSGAFAATANLAILEEGKMIHGLAVKLGFDWNLHVKNAAMDMYGKCGEISDLLSLLPPTIYRSRLSWNILISAYARHGVFDQAKETFRQMLESRVKPDHVTFVSLLSACSHRGLVDEGLSYFESMTKEFGVPAAMEHCVCIIDLFGRSGRFSEAEKFIKEMPIEPNGLAWRSLLSSCRKHGNLELGKVAAQHLIELGPSDDSAYVLYSNACAISGRWVDAENVRSHMELQNVKKQPACSWVKFNNRVSCFGMGGDLSHPQAEQISAMLKELKKLIAEAGYIPDTSFALHDTDDEQKEHNLWNHSERIALAFALINSAPSRPIRVFKNLRVCGDCHSVYKYVSAIVPEMIILRDPYRFHHFSIGKCSCDDYW